MGKFMDGFRESMQASKAAEEAKKAAVVNSVPVEGEGGVRFVGQEGYVTKYLLTVHESHIARRKWDRPDDAPEVLALSAIVGVDIKLRWHAINDVTAKTTAGDREWQFSKPDDAKRLHAVLSDHLQRP